MIVYNITAKVNHAIAGAWLDWLKNEHIPDILQTGCFTNAGIFHLFEADDEEGLTYAVQYHARNISLYEAYIENHAATMRKKSADKWGDQVVAFRTVMEAVN